MGKFAPAGLEKDSVIRQAKWESLREEFLELSITGKDIHWPTLAAKYGFEPQTVRNRASRQKWYSEIPKRRAERENILETKLTERTSMALDQLNKDFATNEAAIRKRHAAVARGLQVRAVKRLQEIDMKDFGPRDALAMLKLGLEEERYAMGMPQVFEGAKDLTAHPEFQPLAQQMGGHKKVQQVGMLLLEALRSTTVADAISDAEAAGLGPTDVEPKDPTPPAPPEPPKAPTAPQKPAAPTQTHPTPSAPPAPVKKPTTILIKRAQQ